VTKLRLRLPAPPAPLSPVPPSQPASPGLLHHLHNALQLLYRLVCVRRNQLLLHEALLANDWIENRVSASTTCALAMTTSATAPAAVPAVTL
jgi:hypothetical protein